MFNIEYSSSRRIPRVGRRRLIVVTTLALLILGTVVATAAVVTRHGRAPSGARGVESSPVAVAQAWSDAFSERRPAEACALMTDRMVRQGEAQLADMRSDGITVGHRGEGCEGQVRATLELADWWYDLEDGEPLPHATASLVSRDGDHAVVSIPPGDEEPVGPDDGRYDMVRVDGRWSMDRDRGADQH